MKTITLTDEQFDTLFEYVDNKVETIVEKSIEIKIVRYWKSGKIYLMFIQY